MVFDSVVRATLENFGHVCPLVNHVLLVEEEDPFFALGPRALFDDWIDVVEPPLSTALGIAISKKIRDLGPLIAMLLHKLQQSHIF